MFLTRQDKEEPLQFHTLEKSEALVDTELGYFVYGERDDFDNFKIGKEFGLSFVKDVDSLDHNVTDDDYDTIILAIKTHGLSAYQNKWAKESLIDNLKTIEECQQFMVQ